ncbi:MAG: flagellar hook-associated protein FlgK [Beijerinckiaceae bacterium]|nr:flagellar hook-associated protein FlgK [Beijerinckiaceae bacterium]
MSLSSAARIAQSGLNTVTAEAAILSRNISGANGTAAYARKIANVISTQGGSQLVSVSRASNLAVFGNMLSATSANAAQEALAAGLEKLSRTIGDVSSSGSGTALDGSSPAALLSHFANALQSYAASPSNSALASAAVDAAATLSRGLNSAAAAVNEIRAQADSKIADSVQTINTLLARFQAANMEIIEGTAAGADVTNAQDARDEILAQLSRELGVTTVTGVNGGISIFTDGGVTLFQGGVARSVTFFATNTYTAATSGNAVYIDGVPITGASATMPSDTGGIVGLAALRDSLTVTYQAQLDAIAGALITSFAEIDQIGSGAGLPGLFTTPGSSSLPASVTGLAGQIAVNPNAGPANGGNPFLLRDGGISGNPNYVYNSTADASYQGRLTELINNLSAAQTFSPSGAIVTSASLSTYASASVSWVEAQRAAVASQQSYQSTLLSAAKTALSNATGVNLDDEMAKMLDLERSYSATAKLIATIDAMFANLLANLGNA